MKKALQEALPYAEAFERLLHPFAEVVVHDLSKDQIAAIYNPLSRREAGDSSYLDRLDFNASDTVIGPYDKTNWDGKPMKSISIVIRNPSGEAEGFLCVNVDTSFFHQAQRLLQSFLKNSSDMPEESHNLFKEDFYEKINLYIQNYCRKHQISLESLDRKNMKEMIKALAASGAFEGKNAANYIGRILGISRATVYNYLGE